jgi:hypothetical protein
MRKTRSARTKHATPTALSSAVAPFNASGPPRQSRAQMISGTGYPGRREATYESDNAIIRAAFATRQASGSRPYPAVRKGSRVTKTAAVMARNSPGELFSQRLRRDATVPAADEATYDQCT